VIYLEQVRKKYPIYAEKSKVCIKLDIGNLRNSRFCSRSVIPVVYIKITID